ncbi:MAG: hypothetical protein J5669_07580 [Bacteroidales bacterium]|nr:hypothetical protein [Bacteroidales bacterium]
MKNSYRIIITLFLGLLAAGQNVWAIVDSYHGGGNGSQNNPYIIADEHDWTLFTNRINNGIEVSKYYKLDCDLTLGSTENPLTTVVGTTGTIPPSNKANERVDHHPFKGYFDGDGHTITVTMSRSDCFAALFGIVDAATICNLTVKGTITSTQKYIAGIAAYVFNESNAINNDKATNIINCTSSVAIDCKVNSDGSIGGLVSQDEKGKLNFENCIFDGTITGMANTEKCGGFMNYSGNNGNAVSFKNCIMAGSINNFTKNTATMSRGSAVRTYTDVYSCVKYGGNNNENANITSASTTCPTDGLVRKYTVNATDYYIPVVEISGLAETSTYDYTSQAITLNPEITTWGNTLVEGTDYSISYQKKNGESYEDVTEIRECGEYRATVAGMGGFAGEKTVEVKVITGVTTTVNAQSNEGIYWTTFYHGTVRHELSEGAQAFTMGNDYKLYRLGTDGHIIPGNTAVVVISETSTIDFTSTDDDTDITINGNGNILQGSDSAVDVTNLSGTPYILSCVNNVIGFYEYTGTSNIPAHKAYYIIQ